MRHDTSATAANRDPLPAPELQVSEWFNTPSPITLAGLRGRVVAIEAFQMLCPGCVSHGLPQAQRIDATFGEDVVVLGIHTVFEHHAAMTPVSLEAFLHEYRIGFPVGVDTHGEDDIPRTMAAFRLRGTPSLVLVDKAGRVRLNAFGQAEDLAVGATVARLVDEPVAAEPVADDDQIGPDGETACDADGCAVS